MTEPLTIKQSPIVIIKNLIVLQFFVTTAYFIAALLANYGEIYKTFTFSQVVSYEIAKFSFITFGELFLVVLIFLRWFVSSYHIYPDRVVIERGIFWKRRETKVLSPSSYVKCEYGPLSKIFRYGAIVFRNPSGVEVKLAHVPNPESYRKKIVGILKEAHQHILEDIKDLEEFLKSGEHEFLEFKATFRWDMREKRINRVLERAVMKTIAAFLNSDGGYVVLGVGDDGTIHGMENDYRSLNRHDADGFENHFTNVFKETVGPEFRRFVKLSFHKMREKELCVIQVFPSSKPVYAKVEGSETFYIRTGNSTTALQLSEVAAYIRSRWKDF